MVFSSSVFLFIFLPMVLFLYYLPINNRTYKKVPHPPRPEYPKPVLLDGLGTAAAINSRIKAIRDEKNAERIRATYLENR